MALNKTVLKNSIKGILQDMINRDVDSADEFADRLATAIDEFVKSADGIYQTGRLQAGANIVVPVSSPAIKLV